MFFATHLAFSLKDSRLTRRGQFSISQHFSKGLLPLVWRQVKIEVEAHVSETLETRRVYGTYIWRM
jgi:hypothetical protein